MAAGSVLTQAFLDFVSGTGVARLTAPDHPIHLATRHFYLWRRWWKNNGQPLDGGQNLTFWFLPIDAGTFEEVLPGTPTTPKNPQVLQKGVANWRMTRAHSTYNDAEILLNDRIRYGTRDAQFEQFVRIRDEKDTIVKASIGNGLELQLGAVPNKTFMEGDTQTTTSPYSVFAHVNESGTGTSIGLFGSGYTATAGVNANGGAWTVKEAIDPTSAAVNGQCNPNVMNYLSPSQDDPTNIIGGLDRLWMACQWEQPENLEKYDSDEKLNNQNIVTSIQGRAAFMSLLRGDQDRYIAGPQDPAYPDPQFHGVPISRWDLLETVALYDSAAAGDSLKTEGLAAGSQKKGPRFYMLNGNFLYPIAHRDRMYFKDQPLRHPQIPDTYVQYWATWWQLVCKSFKHQGVLRPTLDMYVGTANQGSNLY
jgi:hypothetical protein